jgi:membrane-associated phospholipid phosphatase
LMAHAERRGVTPTEWQPRLSPPWAPVAGIAASFVVTILAIIVWHTRWPDPADAKMMLWQEAARPRADGIATAIANAVGPLVVLAALAAAATAWRVRRWDAVALASVTAPGAVAVESWLKQLVHRQRPDAAEALLFPSGHVAVATAVALTVVLVLRATVAPPRKRARAAWLAGCLVLVIAVARLVQTVHYVTDVVGGAALGFSVTCWAALAISAGCRSGRLSRLGRTLSKMMRHLPRRGASRGSE